MTDLLSLAERCEHAAGPDRELDVLIRCAIPDEGEYDLRPSNAFGKVTAKYRGGNHGTWVALSYTASLDAALSLVPEGWSIVVGTYGGQRGPFARLFPPDYANSPLEHQESNACTSLALALCAAALRARAAQ